MVVFSSALRMFTIRVQLKLAALLTSDLGEKVFDNVIHRPYSWHLKHNSSETLGWITNDINQVLGTLMALLGLPINALIVLLLGGSLIALNPGIMMSIALLLGSIYIIIYRLIRTGLVADGVIISENYQAAMQAAQEGLGGIRDIILDHTQSIFVHEYSSQNRSAKLAFFRINYRSQAVRYIIEGVAMFIIVGLALILSLQGRGIEQVLPLLGTLSLGVYRLLMPLQQCFGNFTALKSNEASLSKLLPYLGTVEAKPEVPLAKSRQLMSSSIRLENVWFRYSEDSNWVLRDLSVEIPAGSRVGFVGSTGSGKSTTVDLILGLLIPQKGYIYVGDRPLGVDKAYLRAWQSQVAHVPQQIYLSDACFAENIAFGIPRDQIDMARVRRAAQQARIADLIEAQPQGYQEMVGERGIRLSGGQRQRIGIARALYKQAKVIVFDEATSALDNQTEKEVMATLEGLGRTITVVLIAHRLTTVQNCDCIFQLEQGQLVAQGRYSELLQHSDSFRHLVQLQQVAI